MEFINLNHKKGQVTLFVIIGLVVLAGVAVFLLLARDFTDQSPSTQNLADTVEEAQGVFKPIQQYVEQCLYSVGLEGLQLLGQHGGYIQPLGPQSTSQFTYNPAAPWEADGVSLNNKPSGFIPYWKHSTLPVTQRGFATQLSMPSLDEITLQHEHYISTQLDRCLGEFASLEEKGARIRMQNEPTTTVLYTEENVQLKTEFELDVELADGTKETISSYYTQLPVPFKHLYDSAYYLSTQAVTSNYVEEMLLGVINRFSRVDAQALPPFYAQKTTMAPTIWSQDVVAEELAKLTHTYIPAFSLQETTTQQEVSLEHLSVEDQAFFSLFSLPLFIEPRPRMKVSHSALDFPIYTNVYGSASTAKLIRPTSVEYSMQNTPLSSLAPQQHEQRYQFYYDLSAPYIVEFRQENLSIPQGGYSFIIALEANIQANRHWGDYTSGNWPINYNPSEFEYSIVGEDQITIDPQTNETYQVSQPPQDILFGDDVQRTSKNLTVSTIDATTKEPLAGVYVGVGVGNFAKKTLGQTQQTTTQQALFTGRGPVFLNGYLSLEKEGYLSHVQPINLSANKEVNLGYIALHEKKQVEISVDVFDIHQYIHRPPTANETIMLSVHKLPSHQNKQTFSQLIMFRNGENTSQIELVPGRYEIIGTLIDQQGIVILQHCEKICDSLVSCLSIPKEDRYIPKEDQTMKPMAWGGIEFSKTHPWMIQEQALAQPENTTIHFSVLKFPPPQCYDDLDVLDQLSSLSQEYRSDLLPQIHQQSTQPVFDPELAEEFTS